MKYEFTDETMVFDGIPLQRIIATETKGNVRKGDLGGFIEDCGNLYTNGKCWVGKDSIVCEHAVVIGDAQVLGKSIVRHNSTIAENAVVKDCKVYGHSSVLDNVSMTKCTMKEGIAKGDIKVKNMTITGEEQIFKKNEIKYR